MESRIIHTNGNTCTSYDDWSNHLVEYMDELQLSRVDRKVIVWYNDDIIGEFDFKTGLGFIKTGFGRQVERNKTQSYETINYKIKENNHG